MLSNYAGSREKCNMDFYVLLIRIKATSEKETPPPNLFESSSGPL